MKALVVGDAMIDRYLFGDALRLCPEAPVPVVPNPRQEDRKGGAANVARNIRIMGIEAGELYSKSFESTPIVKLRIVSGQQQIVRVDYDLPQEPIHPDAVVSMLQPYQIVVLSDYGKGSLQHIRHIIGLCKAHGHTVLVDPKGSDPDQYRGADLLKPNLVEAARLVGAWSDEKNLEERVRGMMLLYRVGSVLLTRGAAGATLYAAKETHHIKAPLRAVHDVSGAGDVAIAAFAVGLCNSYGFQKAAELAVLASSISVMRFGTTAVTREELGL